MITTTLKIATINHLNISEASMRRVKSVPASDREQLKIKVDRCNRTLVAAAIDVPYGSLSGKLNAILPLSQTDYDKILAACQKIEGKK